MSCSYEKGVYDVWVLAKHPADQEQCVTCIHVQRGSAIPTALPKVSPPCALVGPLQDLSSWCHHFWLLFAGLKWKHTEPCRFPEPILVAAPPALPSPLHLVWGWVPAADTEGSGSFMPGTAGIFFFFFAGQFVLLSGFLSFVFPSFYLLPRRNRST